jgi:hypothetical protein
VEVFGDVAAQYADFAAYAQGESPCFEDWASEVARDADVLSWLAALPVAKQQPNLVFAAARWHGVAAPGPYAALRDRLLGDDGTLRATILRRSTQTNEVGRLATLVPAFAGLAGGRPVALLEVGASAGLCLYPDRYDYEWRSADGGVRRATGWGPTRPLLRCRVGGNPPLPGRAPRVAWRGGLDLHPLDVADADAMRWLTTLVWPEQQERVRLLEQAVAVARREPPTLVAGDLLDRLPSLVESAAGAGPVVVFHSAVVAYLRPDDRRRFHDTMADLVAQGRCHWVSNEGKDVLPGVTATGPPVPEETRTFVLGVDGRAVAWTHGHGRSMTWLD